MESHKKVKYLKFICNFWRWISVFVACVFGCYIFFLNVGFKFFNDPPIWPDEFLFFSPALNWLETGKLASPFWEGLFPGVKNSTYWMPPGYFIFQSIVYQIFPASLLTMRSISVVLGFLSIVLTTLIFSRYTKSTGLKLLVFTFLCMDPMWQTSALMGRPDFLCVFLMLAAIYCSTYLSDSMLSLRRHKWLSSMIGVLAALAALVHPLGLVLPANLFFVTLVNKNKHHRYPLLKPLVWSIFLILAPYVLICLLNIDDFMGQILPQFLRKNYYSVPLEEKFKHLSVISHLAVPTLVGFLVCSVFGAYQLTRRIPGSWTILTCLLCLIIIFFQAHENWYGIYFSPYLYIGSGFLAELAYFRIRDVISAEPRNLWFWFPLILILVIFANRNLTERIENQIHTARNFRWIETEKKWIDYEDWGEVITENLPAKARVLVAAIPDPSIGLLNRKNVHIFSFSPMPVEDSRYSEFLKSIDYFIVTRNAYDPIGDDLITKFNLNVQFEKRLVNGSFEAELLRHMKE